VLGYIFEKYINKRSSALITPARNDRLPVRATIYKLFWIA